MKSQIKNPVARHSRGLSHAARFPRVAAILPAALSLLAFGADEPAPPEQTFSPTVVIAARREQPLAEVSPSVSLVSGEESLTRGLFSLSDALAAQPGVFIAGADAPIGQQRSVFTRGTESNMTAVLLDGRRVSPGLNGGSEIERYSLTGLDSVEFARGANSTLYGANAAGGVIDMRTRDPLKESGPSGFAGVEAGSFGTVRGAVSASGSRKIDETDLGLSIAGDWTRADGPVANSDYDGNHGLARFAVRPLSGLTFDLLGEIHDMTLGLPGSTAFPSTDNRQWNRGWLLSPGVTWTNDDDLRVRAFYSRTSATQVYHSVSTFGDYDADTDILGDETSLQVDWKASSLATLSAGADIRRTSFDQLNTFGRSAISWEAYSGWARVVFASKDKASEFGFGGRGEWFDDFSAAATGEVFASHAFTETGTKLFAKVANAYSPPAAQDYFFNAPIGTLKPEKVLSYEVGVKQVFFEKTSPLEISAALFRNEMSDLISFVETIPFVYPSFNVGRSAAQGAELALDWKPEKFLRFYANATIQDARVTKDSPAGTPSFAVVRAGGKLARRPDITTTFGVEVKPADELTLGLSGAGVMDREDTGGIDMGDYFTLRAYGSWRVVENAELFARVENIFSEEYDVSGVGFPAPPLAAYAGLRFRF